MVFQTIEPHLECFQKVDKPSLMWPLTAFYYSSWILSTNVVKVLDWAVNQCRKRLRELKRTLLGSKEMRKIWKTGSKCFFQRKENWQNGVPAFVIQLNANGSRRWSDRHSVDYIMLSFHVTLIPRVTYVLGVDIYIVTAKSISSSLSIYMQPVLLQWTRGTMLKCYSLLFYVYCRQIHECLKMAFSVSK